MDTPNRAAGRLPHQLTTGFVHSRSRLYYGRRVRLPCEGLAIISNHNDRFVIASGP